MSIEETLRAKARQAANDESIVDVAIFHPRGFSAAAGAGAGAGSAAGGDSGAGSAIGAAAGSYAAMKLTGASRDLPLSICVAISADNVYLMEHVGATDFAGELKAPFAVLARSRLGVEVHQRAMNRVVILNDESTDESYPLEAPRFGPYHSKAAVKLLMLDEQELEERQT